MSLYEDVGAFHAKFGLPYSGDGGMPRLLDPSEFEFRLGFILEETAELCRAHSRRDLEGCLDALCDLAFVTLGTSHCMRLPLIEGWREVVRANMAKVRASTGDPRSKRNAAFDIVKPDGWLPPDHGPILRAAAASFVEVRR